MTSVLALGHPGKVTVRAAPGGRATKGMGERRLLEADEATNVVVIDPGYRGRLHLMASADYARNVRGAQQAVPARLFPTLPTKPPGLL